MRRRRGIGGGRRLLVTADEFHASLALVRGLRTAGYVPVVAVSRGDSYAARSRAAEEVVSVPSEENEPRQFAQAIADLARRCGAAAVIPGSEPALIALSRHRGAFNVPVGAPAPEVVELATDKNRVLALASKCGLAAPETLSGTPAALLDAAGSLRFPVILKPARSRVETDDQRLALYEATRIESPQALEAALMGLPATDWVIQPFVDGGLSAIAGVSWDGRMVCAVHQVSPRIWPFDVGFSSFAYTTPPDPELDARVARLLECLGWSGLFQVQMLQGDRGQPLVIDFNPRAYGSLALAVGAGANLPAVWAGLLLGHAAHHVSYRAGVRYRLETAEVRAMLAYARGGRVTQALRVAAPRRRTVHAIFQATDPAPSLVALRRLLAKVPR